MPDHRTKRDSGYGHQERGAGPPRDASMTVVPRPIQPAHRHGVSVMGLISTRAPRVLRRHWLQMMDARGQSTAVAADGNLEGSPRVWGVDDPTVENALRQVPAGLQDMPGRPTSEATARESIAADATSERAPALQPLHYVHPSSGCGRRALLLGASVLACGTCARFAGPVLSDTEHQIQQQIDASFAAGIVTGRHALMRELAVLEGVSLGDAVVVANVTRAAVQMLVVPLARFSAERSVTMLSLCIDALDSAASALVAVPLTGGSVALLRSVRSLLATWRDAAQQLPIRLESYAITDIASAQAYLLALRQKVDETNTAERLP